MKRKGSYKEFLPRELGEPVYRRSFLNRGTALIMGTALFTLILWLVQSPSSLGNPFTILAKVSAFSAIVFLSLNFLLSTRARWLESLFGGLDRMYAAHCTVGRISLFWMLIHPLALGLANLGDRERLLEIFLPAANLDISLGTASLMLFIVLLLLTMVFALPFQDWRWSHRFMGMVLLLAGVHALRAGSDVAAHPPLYAWTAALVLVGMASFLYTLYLYPFLGPRTEMVIVEVTGSKGTTDILLEHDGELRFRAGQFVYACFRGTDRQSHPFSISGWDGRRIRLSVKAAGDMTSALASKVKKGDHVLVRGPYGRFGEKRSSDKDEVWVAGGIGITPFLSLLQEERLSPSGRKILLIWSYRVHGELPYEREIVGSLEDVPGLTFVHWNSSERGRIDARAISELVKGRLEDRCFMICGPRAMMRALGRQLVSTGVSPSDVVLEDFNLV